MVAVTNLQTRETLAFRAVVDDVARQLVETIHRTGASFIRTPILYPSGATVVVRIQERSGQYIVSDMALGYEEAEQMGIALLYSRSAIDAAERSGIRYEEHAFSVINVSRDQLPSAVATVANCSQEGVAHAFQKRSERKEADDAERIYVRLVDLFSPESVIRDTEVLGASHTPWNFAAAVQASGSRKLTVFEPVNLHHSSIAHAAMKFHDVARLARPPKRVAVVRNKAGFGTWLGILSQAADVVDRDISSDRLMRMVGSGNEDGIQA